MEGEGIRGGNNGNRSGSSFLPGQARPSEGPNRGGEKTMRPLPCLSLGGGQSESAAPWRTVAAGSRRRNRSVLPMPMPTPTPNLTHYCSKDETKKPPRTRRMRRLRRLRRRPAGREANPSACDKGGGPSSVVVVVGKSSPCVRLGSGALHGGRQTAESCWPAPQAAGEGVCRLFFRTRF
jgi:hypothetical protein